MKLSTKLLRIKTAITSKRRLTIKYKDIIRDVEAHILGYNHRNEPVLRVFERARDNLRSNQFKIYFISDIQTLVVSSRKFNNSVTKPTDEHIPHIILTTYAETQEEN